jgi:tripartite-type tricarboxylate transporter receptor subunit TctC
MKLRSKSILWFAALLLVAQAVPLFQEPAWTQESYPSKPITFVVGYPPASAIDLIARKLGQEITKATGKAVIVDNRVGAVGMIACQFVAHAPADGYTVLLTPTNTHAANPHLYKKLPYSPEKDFAPVGGLGKNGAVFVVRPDSPIKTVRDLVQLMRARPGKITFASGNVTGQAASELLRAMTKTEAVHVPYKGEPPALTDLMGGQIDFMAANLVPAIPLIKSGKLRAIAVTTLSRNSLLPDIPAVQETAGLEGYEMTTAGAVFVPAGTPAPIISRLNSLLVSAVKSDEYRKFAESVGSPASVSTPEALGQLIRSEYAKWARIVKAAGIEPE